MDIGWFIFGGLFLYAIPAMVINIDYKNEISRVLKIYKRDFPKEKISSLDLVKSVPEGKDLPHTKELDLCYQRLAELWMLNLRWNILGFAGYITILFVGMILTRIFD